jgi:plastocyanin
MKELLFALGFVAISTIGFAQDEICPGANVLVSAAGMAYSPQDLVVDAGTVVGWVNYDGYHDVNGTVNSITQLPFDNPEAFQFEANNGTEEGVCIGTYAFTVPGLYLYDCSSYGHAVSGMVGSVTCNEIANAVQELGDASISIFPNPVASILTITMDSPSALQVFDAVGKLVEETSAVASWVVDVSAWEKGLYMVNTQAGEAHKFIVE